MTLSLGKKYLGLDCGSLKQTDRMWTYWYSALLENLATQAVAAQLYGPEFLMVSSLIDESSQVR